MASAISIDSSSGITTFLRRKCIQRVEPGESMYVGASILDLLLTDRIFRRKVM